MQIYNIIIAVFLIINKVKKIWFFQKIFWIANISLKIGFKMLVFIFKLKSLDKDFIL